MKKLKSPSMESQGLHLFATHLIYHSLVLVKIVEKYSTTTSSIFTEHDPDLRILDGSCEGSKSPRKS